MRSLRPHCAESEWASYARILSSLRCVCGLPTSRAGSVGSPGGHSAAAVGEMRLLRLRGSSGCLLGSASSALRGVVLRKPSRALSRSLSDAAASAAPRRQQVDVPTAFDPPPPSVSRSATASSSSSPSSASAPSLCNITPDVLARVGRNLHLVPSHPLQLLKSRIEQFFQPLEFSVFDSLPPRVTVEQNFDQLLVPPSHSSRKTTDTVSTRRARSAAALLQRPPRLLTPLLRSLRCCLQYYFDSEHCLRTHTSAHQTQVGQRTLHAGRPPAGQC